VAGLVFLDLKRRRGQKQVHVQLEKPSDGHSLRAPVQILFSDFFNKTTEGL
jgi:hypothetical protein